MTGQDAKVQSRRKRIVADETRGEQINGNQDNTDITIITNSITDVTRVSE
jgi:hypothetical protein